MRQPYNLTTLLIFEAFADECRHNAKVNAIVISHGHIMDMWRHLPEQAFRNPPLFNSDLAYANAQGQYTGPLPSPACVAYCARLDKDIEENRRRGQ